MLGESNYLYEGFSNECEVINLPLDKFDSNIISFTYTDSMVTNWLVETHQDKEYFNPNVHGKVFLKGEINNIIDQFGIPENEWKSQKDRAYDFFIEAQIWCQHSLKQIN